MLDAFWEEKNDWRGDPEKFVKGFESQHLRDVYEAFASLMQAEALRKRVEPLLESYQRSVARDAAAKALVESA